MRDPRETLARIRKQTDAATDGPWRHISIFEVGGFVEDSHGRELFDWAQDDAGTICAPDSDAEFIAAARTTVPTLLDLAESVLDRHRKSDYTRLIGFSRADGEEYYCVEDQKTYPCPTVTDITRELERHHD